MKKIKILLIDDDFFIRQIIKVLLNKFADQQTSLEFFSSYDGVEGLGFMYVTNPDIVILDATLPKYSGREVVDYLISNKHFADKSVIVLSSKDKKVGVLPENYIVLEKEANNFTKDLFKTFTYLITGEINKKKIISKSFFSSQIIKFAHISDTLFYKITSGNLLMKLINFPTWFVIETATAFVYTLYSFFVQKIKDANIKQEKRDLLLFRVKSYPAIALVLLPIVFLSFQLFLYAVGGIAISNIRVQSIFANSGTEYTIDLAKSTFDSSKLELNGGITLKSFTQEIPIPVSYGVEIKPEIISKYYSDKPAAILEDKVEFSQLLGIAPNFNITNNNGSSYNNETEDIQQILTESSLIDSNGLTFQLSPDKQNWYYFDADKWKKTELEAETSNDILDVNKNINLFERDVSFDTTNFVGTLYLKVFFVSNGSYKVTLSHLRVLRVLDVLEVTTLSLPPQETPSEEIPDETPVSSPVSFPDEVAPTPEVTPLPEDVNIDLVVPTLFQATFENGNKLIYGKILGDLPVSGEISVEGYYTNNIDTTKPAREMGELIGSAKPILNANGELIFLIVAPSREGGYVTTRLVRDLDGEKTYSILSNPLENSTYTVDGTQDNSDSDTGDGLCLTGLGNCTLRAAIEQANAHAGADTIFFNIPTISSGFRTYSLPNSPSTGSISDGQSYWTIRPGSALPAISESTIIDGSSQTTNQGDYNDQGPEIEIKGNAVIEIGLELTPTSDGSTLAYLGINNFADLNIYVNQSDTFVLTSSYIGIDIRANAATSSNYALKVDTSNNVTIGNNLATGNYFANSKGTGYNTAISCGGLGGTKTITYRGNKLGVNYGINSKVGSPLINAQFVGDCNATIGGTTTSHSNVFGGANSVGLNIDSDGGETNSDYKVYKNYFGTDSTGTVNLSNFLDINIQDWQGGSFANTVKIGDSSARGNLFKYSFYGVAVDHPRPAAISYNTFGNIGNNIITVGNQYTNDASAYSVVSITNNQIGQSSSDPYFGFNITGAGEHGIVLNRASAVVKGNIISGNGKYGIIARSYVPGSDISSIDGNSSPSVPIIGGSSALTGSLCSNEANCIKSNTWGGVYSIDGVAFNEATIYTDNDWTGGNGNSISYEQAWLGLGEIISGTVRRTDLADGSQTINFTSAQRVKANENPSSILSSASNVLVNCSLGFSCPLSGATSGLAGKTMVYAPSGSSTDLFSKAQNWFNISEYVINNVGVKTTYGKLNTAFTFDGNSTTNPLSAYPGKGEPWSDSGTADRDLGTANFGRFQISESEFADGTPVYNGSDYTIIVDTTTDEDNVSITGVDNGGGVYSGGGSLGVDGAANGKTSLREAIIISNKHPGADRIHFSIPLADSGYRDYDTPSTPSSGDSTGGDDYWSIPLTSSLPSLTGPTVVDASTQETNQGDRNSGAPDIEVTKTSGTIDGFTIDGSDITINKIVINNLRNGVNVLSNRSNITITRSYFGLDIKGIAAKANTTASIATTTTTNLIIGGDTSTGNVIANGIITINCGLGTTLPVTIRGNIIGLNANQDISSSTGGIGINGDCDFTLGGDLVTHRNIISGHQTLPAVTVSGTAANQYIKIYNNFFGTDSTGTLNRGNLSQDINLTSSTILGPQGYIGAAGKGNLFRFGGTVSSDGIRVQGERDLLIQYNSFGDKGRSAIFMGNAPHDISNYRNVEIFNNYMGAAATDPYFGVALGGLASTSAQGAIMNWGAESVIKGNKITGNAHNAIYHYNKFLTDSKRNTPTDDMIAKATIGGQSSFTGSLCGGLEKNCISSNGWGGIYSIESVPSNEATLWSDNDFTGGNGPAGAINIEQVWFGLFELFSGTSRRTDLANGAYTLNFPAGTRVKTGDDPATIVTSATNLLVTCLSAADCPTTPGNSGGTSSSTEMIVPSGSAATILNTVSSWFKITEYIYSDSGVKTDYKNFNYNSSHLTSKQFSFDGNSTSDSAEGSGASHTSNSITYTDKGEPWTNNPTATRNVATGDLGRFEVMEVDIADARPIYDGANYIITVDSTSDEDNVSTSGIDNGGGAYSGGGGSGTSGPADGKTSLREAIIVANNHAGPDRIYFNIPTTDTGYRDFDAPNTPSSGDSIGGDDYWTIRPATALPSLGSSIYIDASTQETNQGDKNTGMPDIELNGVNIGTAVNGLGLIDNASSVVINKLIINRFSVTNSTGIGIAPSSPLTGITITNNVIGLDSKGITAASNYYGITNANVATNTILIQNNIIAGNSAPEINFIRPVNGLNIYGNIVGLNSLGNLTGVNPTYGINLSPVAGTSSNVNIGDGTPGGRNVVASHTSYNISISATSNLMIRGNYVGTNLTGTASRNATGTGIITSSVTDSQIGGPLAGDRNIVSGHTTGTGINPSVSSTPNTNLLIQNNFVGTDVTGTSALPNNNGMIIQIGNLANSNITIKGNLIRFNNAPTITDANFIKYVGNAAGVFFVSNSAAITFEENEVSDNFPAGILARSVNGAVAAPGDIPANQGIIRNNIIGSGTSTIVPSMALGGNNYGIRMWGSTMRIYGNRINGNTKYGIENVLRNSGGYFISRPQIGGTSALTGSLCSGLQKNCITGNGWGGIYSAESAPYNEATIATDNDFGAGNTSGINVEQSWFGLLELFSGTARRTDLTNAALTVNFPAGTRVKTLADPSTVTTSGTNYSLTCTTPSDCPASGATNGVAGQTEVISPFSTSLISDQSTWYHVTEYTIANNGTQTNYSAWSFNQNHQTSKSFTFDANSTTNALTYPGRGEPWTNNSTANRDIATAALGLKQILELDLVDANPILNSGTYEIFVERASDEDNVSLSGVDDGGGAYSGGGGTGASGIADGKTSLREAVNVANNLPDGTKIIFNIPTSDPNYNTGSFPGAFRIQPTTVMSLYTAMIIDGTTQTTFTGDTKAAVTDSTVGPEIILDLATNASPYAFDVNDGATIKGLGIYNNAGANRAVNVTVNNFTAQNNDFVSNTHGAIRFNINSGNYNVTGNVFRANAGNEAILFGGTNPQGGSITSNTFIDNVLPALSIEASPTTNLTISSNRFIHNGSYAVEVYSGAGTSGMRYIIDNNLFQDNENGGVLVANSNNYKTTITNNKFLGTSLYTPINLSGGTENAYGATDNDTNDLDSGPNMLMNSPTITTYIYNGGGQYTLGGNINNKVSGEGEFSVEVCESTAHVSGNGGCLRTLATVEHLAQSSDGNTPWNTTITIPGDNGTENRKFTVLATNSLGATSEFSSILTEGRHTVLDYPITIVSPKGGAVVTTATPTLIWNATTDPDIATYEVYLNGNLITTVPAGQTSYTLPTPYLDGNYNWQVKDKRVNSTYGGVSPVENFTIDTTIPIALISPIGGVSISNPMPTLTWNATIDPLIQTYQVYLDGNLIATIPSAQHAYTLTTALDVGLHNWQIKGIRTNGQSSGQSVVETFNRTPNSSQDIILIGPIGGIEITEVTPTLSWNPTSNPDVISYDVYLDGTLIDTIPVSQTSLTLSSITLGNHTWQVKGKKSDNTVITVSVVENFNEVYRVYANAPANQSSLSTLNPVFSWTDTHNTDVSYFKIYLNGNLYKQVTGYTYTAESEIPEGNYEWFVEAYNSSDQLIGTSSTNDFTIKQIFILNVDSDVNASSELDDVNIVWDLSPTNPPGGSTYNIIILDNNGVVILQINDLPNTQDSYQLTDEQLNLLLPGINYTVSVTLVNSQDIVIAQGSSIVSYVLQINLISNTLDSIGLNSPEASATATTLLPIALVGLTTVVTSSITAINVLGVLFGILIPHKRRYWGIVFDAETSKPLAFTTVRVINTKDNKIYQTVSDLEGRYGINVERAGSYTISALLSNYNSFEKEIVVLNPEHEVIEDIALTRLSDIASDFKLFIVRNKAKFINWFNAILLVLTILGFIYTLFVTLTSPTAINFVILSLYLIIFFLNSIILLRTNFAPLKGRVINKASGMGVEGVVVRLFTQDSKSVTVAMTDENGLMRLNIAPGSYIAKASKAGYVLDNAVEGQEIARVIIRKDGYLEKDIVMRPSSQAIDASLDIEKLDTPFGN